LRITRNKARLRPGFFFAETAGVYQRPIHRLDF
jgi:hypothetical protein